MNTLRRLLKAHPVSTNRGKFWFTLGRRRSCRLKELYVLEVDLFSNMALVFLAEASGSQGRFNFR